LSACLINLFDNFIYLEGELLKTAILLPQTLGGFSMAALLIVKLNLELTYTLLKLLDHPLASLQGIGLSLILASLELLDLVKQTKNKKLVKRSFYDDKVIELQLNEDYYS